jgi:hypothetical protein
MARTTINSQGVPVGTITASDLSYPLADFSSTGIDDNASSNAITISSGQAVTMSGLSYPTSDGSANQVLTTNGSGALTFADTSSGGVEYVAKTTTYTASANEGIIANTSGGAWTLTLPASPSTGDKVFVADGGNWATNNLTVARNGSTIEGSAADFVMDYGGVNVGFIYDGSTWQVYPQAGFLGLRGIDDNATSTAITIDSNENVGISATPNNYSDYVTLTLDSTQGGVLDIEKNGTVQAELWTYRNSDDVAFAAAHASGSIRLMAGGFTERARIQAGGGISFNGDTAAANALDDYEEGTFTPSYSTTSGSFSAITYSYQQGWYTKVGNHVTAGGRIILSAYTQGTASGNVFINLPFTIKAAYFTGTIVPLGGWTSYVPNTCYGNPSNANIFVMTSDWGSSSAGSITPAMILSTADMMFTISYTV